MYYLYIAFTYKALSAYLKYKTIWLLLRLNYLFCGADAFFGKAANCLTVKAKVLLVCLYVYVVNERYVLLHFFLLYISTRCCS